MLIVMEGACDGIGKSTQYAKLADKLTSLCYKPQYDIESGLRETLTIMKETM